MDVAVNATAALPVPAGDMMETCSLPCRPLKQSLSRKDIKCLTKLLVDSKSQKVVGIHMVGAEAAEIVQVSTCCPPRAPQGYLKSSVTCSKVR